MKTTGDSISALLAAIEKSKDEDVFDIAADIQMLIDIYPKTSKRNYLELLRKLLEKYTSTEQAVIHAALMQKCKTGDAAAIKLWSEQKSSFGGNKDEVVIIDDIGKIK